MPPDCPKTPQQGGLKQPGKGMLSETPQSAQRGEGADAGQQQQHPLKAPGLAVRQQHRGFCSHQGARRDLAAANAAGLCGAGPSGISPR